MTTQTELDNELLQREESAQQILSHFAPALEALNKAREALEAAAAQYVTRTEVQTTLVDGITEVVNRRFDELSAEDEKRHNLLVQQTEARFALTATKEELAGVITAGAENTTRIDRIEASHDTRLTALEKRADRTEDIQRKQTESIEAIKQDTHAIQQSASSMNRDFTALLARDEKRQTDVDRELAALKTSQAQDVKEIRENRNETNNLRADVEGLRGDIGATIRPMQDTVRNLTPRVAQLESQVTVAAKVIDKVEWVAGGVSWLFKDRRGNIVLAILIAALVGFQIYYGVLSYQLNQRYSELISIVASLKLTLQ